MRALIALVALAAALIPLNSTLVALALPTIADDLETDVSAASWLVSAYLVAMVSFQAPAGKAGDRIGPERALRIGLVAFALASIAAAAAPSLELLVAMRVAQAAA
nr:MFS transporter [Actinomycetota bacterium]